MNSIRLTHPLLHLLTHRRFTTLAALFITLLSAYLHSPVHAATPPPQYTITHLGDVPGKSQVVGYTRGLNNHGQVVGHGFNTFLTDEVAFIWDGSMMFLPNFAGAVLSRAQAINDKAQIVGEIAYSLNDRRATIWEGGKIRDLGNLPGDGINVAFGINNLGQVVGTARQNSTVPVRARVWDKGQIISLPELPGTGDSRALHINDKGQIVGVSGPTQAAPRAVLWENNTIKELASLGGTVSRASAINAQGQIAGFANLANGQSRAALWEGDTVRDLGTLGGTNSVAQFLNAQGQVVGQARTAANQNVAFLWQDGAMYDLNTLIPANSDWVLQIGEAINDRGQISGFGLYKGAVRGFLLTPVPELNIERAVILSWSTNLTGRVLETAFSVSGPWTPVEGTPTVVGSQNTVTVRASNPAALFRLRQP